MDIYLSDIFVPSAGLLCCGRAAVNLGNRTLTHCTRDQTIYGLKNQTFYRYIYNSLFKMAYHAIKLTECLNLSDPFPLCTVSSH